MQSKCSTEIVVGTVQLRLPSGWTWKQEGSGWCAISPFHDVVVRADVHGEEGVHVCAWSDPSSNMYVPAIVIALVVLANDDGDLSNTFQKMGRYVTSMPELEEEKERD